MKTGNQAERPVFRFENYDRAELEDCGKAFVADIDHVYRPGPGTEEPPTEEWTELVLDWFASSAADGLLVDGRRSDTRANWKLRWPQLAANSPGNRHWHSPLHKDHETLVAWFFWRDPGPHRRLGAWPPAPMALSAVTHTGRFRVRGCESPL